MPLSPPRRYLQATNTDDEPSLSNLGGGKGERHGRREDGGGAASLGGNDSSGGVSIAGTNRNERREMKAMEAPRQQQSSSIGRKETPLMFPRNPPELWQEQEECHKEIWRNSTAAGNPCVGGGGGRRGEAQRWPRDAERRRTLDSGAKGCHSDSKQGERQAFQVGHVVNGGIADGESGLHRTRGKGNNRFRRQNRTGGESPSRWSRIDQYERCGDRVQGPDCDVERSSPYPFFRLDKEQRFRSKSGSSPFYVKNGTGCADFDAPGNGLSVSTSGCGSAVDRKQWVLPAPPPPRSVTRSMGGKDVDDGSVAGKTGLVYDVNWGEDAASKRLRKQSDSTTKKHEPQDEGTFRSNENTDHSDTATTEYHCTKETYDNNANNCVDGDREQHEVGGNIGSPPKRRRSSTEKSCASMDLEDGGFCLTRYSAIGV